MPEPASAHSFISFMNKRGTDHHGITLNSLPIELLVFIFSFCIGDGWAGRTVLTLQLVCRKWRVCILSSSHFWRTIRIELHDNEQVPRIEGSLKARLKEVHPRMPIHVEVLLRGLGSHDTECRCGREGHDDGHCVWQEMIVKNFFALLNILIGPQGCHMARWASFLLDISEWNSSDALLWEDYFDFGSMFDYPAPILRKVHLSSLRSERGLFYDAPFLSAVRLTECIINVPMNLSRVKRLWIDHWVEDELQCAYWKDLVHVEELTLRIWWDIDVDPSRHLDDIRFTSLRKLRFLGDVPEELLEAVGDCRLEQLILRVNSPADLELVANSGIDFNAIGEIVLGGFNKEHYSESLNESARTAAFRALFQRRNGPNVENLLLLGDRVTEELARAGVFVENPLYWTAERNEGELGVIEPWDDDEWEGKVEGSNCGCEEE